MAKKKLTYLEAMQELENILAQMEENTLEIDSLADRVKRASELIAFCKEQLRTTEQEVDKVVEGLSEI